MIGFLQPDSWFVFRRSSSALVVSRVLSWVSLVSSLSLPCSNHHARLAANVGAMVWFRRGNDESILL